MPRFYFLLSLSLAAFITVSTSHAAEPLMDTDRLLKPLMDTNPGGNEKLQPLQGGVEKAGSVPVRTEPPVLILQGKVQTLQEAIETETDVDWYAWYMTARTYLGRTGGLQCNVGTPIKFHKDGRIEALSMDSACIASVVWRRFPLPRQTRLEALILPVRNGNGPAATPEELYSRIEKLKKP